MSPVATSKALDPTLCQRAYRSRDSRFDGRFFIGVGTTGIYCRPVCPVKPPKPENIVFYPTAAAAAEAGLRPCLRCRPETGAGTPDWSAASSKVNRALRLIGEGVAEEGGVAVLAEALDISARHLHRLFIEHLGATPVTVIRTRRLHLAKRLIDDTDLRLADVAYAAGFGSVRRFNATFQDLYGRTPGELRRARRHGRVRADEDPFVFRLSYRPPLDWHRMLDFFALRATPGIEEVRECSYRRSFRLGDGQAGILTVRHASSGDALELEIHSSEPAALLRVVDKARRLFDLSADPAPIADHLSADPTLGHAARRMPGLRVPGAWDGFEVTIRAILGQQVSVKGATTLAGRIAERCGEALPFCCGAIGRLSPTPEQLLSTNLAKIDMPGSRADTLKRVAEAVLDGTLVFDSARPDVLRSRMLAIAGIGEWTAQYVAMRLGEPDAFPASDLGLLKSPALAQRPTPKQLLEQAEAWRPWRAYAAVLLWHATGETP
ncbi:MAG: AlkA N-terminal domain-containing protein [Acidobacteriota bacterium]|nr:AlkA N-terminal domain-containing protein [Acidobacteriota bacterium]